MTLPDLIKQLQLAAQLSPGIEIGATFQAPVHGSLIIASLDLVDVLLAPESNQLVLHFAPLPIISEAMQIATSIQKVIDDLDPADLEEDEDEEEDDEEEEADLDDIGGLSF